MRLISLKLSGFKNLDSIDIPEFNDCPTLVLVGPNGAGKSNLLEALINIFRSLSRGEATRFDYTLRYMCAKNEMIARSKRGQLSVTANGARLTRSDLVDHGVSHKYLPEFVLGYYSGPSNRMEELFTREEAEFSRDLRQRRDRHRTQFFYGRLVYSHFALLSFFLSKDKRDRSLLTDFLRVERFDSVLFVLSQPDWANERRHLSEDDQGDPRFWNARGVVADFLGRLHRTALAPLRLPSGRWYFYLPDQESLTTLAHDPEDPQNFFREFASLYLADLVEDVHTSIVIRGVEGALTYRELSEGEQQLLLVLGLVRFLEENEGLILLDEPDTHLNPAWSIQYPELLRQTLRSPATTQVILASHDPLVVAGMTKDQVHFMHRDKDGHVRITHPDRDPRGRGVASLLTSELYGLRSAVDLHTQEQFDRKRELLGKVKRSKKEASELAELTIELGSLDFTTQSVSDPLFAPFVDAMSEVEREHGWLLPTLNSEQRAERESAAKSIASTLLGDGPRGRSSHKKRDKRRKSGE
jgi:ABC-type cobalamin/Fe3+-siderophores transport system ATPase subunit